MKIRISRIAPLGLAYILGITGPAAAAGLTMWDFAAFSGGGLTTNGATTPETRLGSNVTVNGLVGSNQDISISGGSQVNATGLYVGGYLDMGTNAVVGNSTTFANVIVNGSNSSGSQEAMINGDIYGNLYVTGDVTLQGNADIKKVGGVGGNVEYTGTDTHNSSPVIEGSETQVGSTTQFALVTIPGATSFTAGTLATQDRACNTAGCSTLTLGPDTYRDLVIGNNKTLELSCGDYYFNSINVGSGLTLKIDLSCGTPVNIYDVGVANFGSSQNTVVKGPGTGGLYVSPSVAPSLASLIYIETHDKFNVNSGTEFAGTVFASQFEANGSDESFLGTGIQWYGAIYAFDSLDIHSDSTLNFVKSYRAPSADTQAAVPEPTSLLLLGTGILGLARRRWKKQA